MVNLIMSMLIIALSLFGCWKFRQGVDGWRVSFSTLSILYGLVMVIGLLLDPHQLIAPETPDIAMGLILFVLTTAALVLAWLPNSRRYFREMGPYRKAMQSLRMQARGLTPHPPQACGPPPQVPQGQPPYEQQPPQHGQASYYGNPPQ